MEFFYNNIPIHELVFGFQDQISPELLDISQLQNSQLSITKPLA